MVLLGEEDVGKASIISQFALGKFDPDYITSLNSQFISKTIEFKNEGKTLKFDIWDTAGQEKYRSLAKIFYKDAKVIFLVYDITNAKSFSELKSYWYGEVKEKANSDVIIAIVANKNDLYENAQVKNEEGEEFARSIGAIFQSVSAKGDTGISTLFDNVGHKYFEPDFNLGVQNKQIKEEYKRKKTLEMEKKMQPKGIKLSCEETIEKPKKKKC